MALSKPKFPKIVIADPSFPEGYGYVILTAAGSFFVNQWLARRVMRARKEHNVEFPIMYSPDDMAFNCIQRGHQSYLEYQPFFLLGLMVGGLQFPRSCSALGCLYLAGRVVYAKNYTIDDTKKRLRGAFGFIGLLGLMGSTISYGIRQIHATCEHCK